jgi:DNA mismatch repair protein MutS2
MNRIADNVTLEALDFPLLVQVLASWAQTSMGREKLKKIKPIADLQKIEERHSEVAELRSYIEDDGALQLAPACSLEEVLRVAGVEGKVLDFGEMMAVYRTVQVGCTVRRQFAGQDRLTRLSAMADSIPDLKLLAEQIEKVFDEEGKIRDSASTELAALRHKKRKLRSTLLHSLEQMVKRDDPRAVLRDRLVTQRGDRYVVPVRAEHRSIFPGVVHDTSSSGQTIYVEPLEFVDQQNALVEFDRQEQEEVQRLLADLTGHIRAVSDALAATEQTIARLDACQAIAQFADIIDAVRPIVTDGALSLRGARHPLMVPGVTRKRDRLGPEATGEGEERHSFDERHVPPVPLDVEIDSSTRALVITGPNTGGKTIVLKTIGLLTLMAQCGVPVPAEVARLSCRPRIYADIGDEQSVVANLSTFSGHLTRIKQFLDDLLPGSLVVLDELGTGTDPAEGAALGIAVLEHLANLEAMTIVSTHHDALKAFAHSSKCSVNASMEFDSESLQPTYTLRIGRPGRSNAFDIAETLGVEASLVERARGLVDINAAQLDSLIRSVENEAEALASDREEIQEQQNGLEKAHAQYESLNRELVEFRQSLVGEGRAAIDEAIKRLRSRGDKMLAALSKELDETRKSRTAQDRRARWAARIGDADAGARRDLDAVVDASVWTMEKLRDDVDILAASTVQEVDTKGTDEILQIDGDLETPLKRGQMVFVKPLNLRGQVVRNWVGNLESEASVEVDVHGKRLIVRREQVLLLAI